MARFLSAVGLVLLIGVLFTGPVLGEDLNKPPWRGDYGTGYAMWEFGLPGQPIGHYDVPDDWSNPGVPILDVDAGYGRNWLPDWDGRIGVWPLSGDTRLSAAVLQHTVSVVSNTHRTPLQ